jgi:SAM-dependent methyltransferase/uncharacterized protein YbaR (Trm112 family)
VKLSTLADVVCPAQGEAATCHSPLTLSENLPITQAPGDEQDMVEGLLRCAGCGAEYPILCGLAVLLPETLTYLRQNYYLILGLAAERQHPLSQPMLDHLQRQGAHITSRESSRGWNYSAARTLSLYLGVHYDDVQDTLSPVHPLVEFMRGYRRRDPYTVLMEMLTPRLEPTQRALDIGCNVGRMARELAARCAAVYGVDLAFGAAYTARRALMGRPTPLTAYELFRDGHIRQSRALDLPPFQNAEVLIASGVNLPFPDAAFDVVNSANVIDVVPDPAQLLREKARALKSGGLFAISDPYCWGIAAPVEKWPGGRDGLPSAQAVRQQLAQVLEILAEADDVPWVLRDHDRKFSVYLNHCLVGRKREAAQGGADDA